MRFLSTANPSIGTTGQASAPQRWLLSLLCVLCVLMGLLPQPQAAAQSPLQALAEPTAAAAPPAAAPADAASAALLADMLEDEATRTKLIAHLRQAAAQEAEQEHNLLPAAVSHWAISYAQGLANEFAATVDQTIQGIKELSQEEGMHLTWQQWWTALMPFLGVLLAALGTFWVLRRLAAICYTRMDDWLNPLQQPPQSGKQSAYSFKQRAWVMFGGLLIDLAAVLAATAAGVAVSALLREPGKLATQLDAAFLKTFFVVEVIKAMLRLIFAPRYVHLRLLDVPTKAAAYWTSWLSHLVTVTGYCIAIAGPLAKVAFSPAVGTIVGLLVMLAVYIYAIGRIWRKRREVKIYVLRKARHCSTAFLSTLLRLLAFSWHWWALAYFTVLFVISQLDPDGALPFMIKASFDSVIIIAIGLLVSNFLSTLIARHIGVSKKASQRMPMLEARLNTYVPFFLRITRTFVLLSACLLLLHAWGVFDVMAWVNSSSGQHLISAVAQVVLVLALALLVWTVLASLIEQRMTDQHNSAQATSARVRTLLSLLRNALLVLIIAMSIMVILSQLGVNIAPLLAGAGVAGLAIGFGAQKLVQDIINGVFIQIENGMNQNDVVEIAGIFGTVERITIRSVGLRTLDGAFHLIPFSSVDTVTNHMRDFSYHLGEYTVAYRESVDDAMYHLEQAFKELKKDPVLAPEILEDMTIPGVTSLNERGFTIRVLIKTKPGLQWAVQRGFNRLVKKHFNAANIELPYPQTVVYFGQNKNGDAPPMRWSRYDPDAEPQENSPAAGHTPRHLRRSRRQDRPEDVLGNEMERINDDEGHPLQEGGNETKST